MNAAGVLATMVTKRRTRGVRYFKGKKRKKRKKKQHIHIKIKKRRKKNHGTPNPFPFSSANFNFSFSFLRPLYSGNNSLPKQVKLVGTL